MKYEDPKLELIEVVEREVFMANSNPITDGGEDDNPGIWNPVIPGEDF